MPASVGGGGGGLAGTAESREGGSPVLATCGRKMTGRFWNS